MSETCIRRARSVWTTCSCSACTVDRFRRNKLNHAGLISRAYPSTAAWERIDVLIEQGYSPAWIASAADLYPTTIERALHQRRHTGVARAFGEGIAAAIVEADMEEATAGHRTSIGTRRRLRALAVQGWTLKELHQRTGLPQNTMSVTQAGDTLMVTSHLWRGVRDVYDVLAEIEGPSRPGRARARNKGWLGPIWWDNPDTDPDPTEADASDVDEVAVLRILDGDGSVAPLMTPAERREATARWQASGRSLVALEALTGWRTHRYVAREVSA